MMDKWIGFYTCDNCGECYDWDGSGMMCVHGDEICTWCLAGVKYEDNNDWKDLQEHNHIAKEALKRKTEHGIREQDCPRCKNRRLRKRGKI